LLTGVGDGVPRVRQRLRKLGEASTGLLFDYRHDYEAGKLDRAACRRECAR